QIVGDVRAEVVAAGAQLARRQLAVADVEEQQRLHGVDVGPAGAVELVLDDVQKTAVQPLDEPQGLQIERLDTDLFFFLDERIDRSLGADHLTASSLSCCGTSSVLKTNLIEAAENRLKRHDENSL